MNWFIVGVIVLFFTVTILTSDRWLDKLLGTHPIHDWDESRQFRRQLDALEPKRVQPDYLFWADEESQRPAELGGPTTYDFRPEHKRGPHEH